MTFSIFIVLLFSIGYFVIVIEQFLKVDKTVPALLLGAICWILIGVLHPEIYNHKGVLVSHDEALFYFTSKIAEILFFLIGAMTIVELIDLHQGFGVLTNLVRTKNGVYVLWFISLIGFFLAAILDILASTIVVVKLLQKLIPDEKERLPYIGISVVIINIGGVWSPIGCVTTTMLWIGGQISAGAVVKNLFLPAIVSAIFLLVILSTQKRFQILHSLNLDRKPILSTSYWMLIIGLMALVLVPTLHIIANVPPYLGMCFSLGIMWLISEWVHPNESFDEINQPDSNYFKVTHALSRIEMSSILFFLGILLAVASLEALGILRELAIYMDKHIGNRDFIAICVGLASAVIDNVPILAAVQGMYHDPIDNPFWHLIALTAGIGGSIFVIGSASGVAAMGLEKNLSFGWYLRNISLWALIAYSLSIIVFRIANWVF